MSVDAMGFRDGAVAAGPPRRRAIRLQRRGRCRLILLHARARGIPLAATALVLIAAAAWAAGYALAHPDMAPGLPGGALPHSDISHSDVGIFQPGSRIPVIAGAALLAILLHSGGLAGHDPDLEQTMPTRWRAWRAVHVAGILVVVGVLLSGVVIPGAATFGAAAMVRNVMGYLGMTALSATVLGVSLAWAPPLLYGATVYLAAPSDATGAALWWAWPMQPGTWDASWICAAALLLIGCAAYIHFGAAHRPE